MTTTNTVILMLD